MLKGLFNILTHSFGALKAPTGAGLKNLFTGTSERFLRIKSAQDSWHALKFGMAMNLGATILIPGTPEEKLKGFVQGVGAWYMTMGMNSPWRQAFWSTALAMSPHFGSMTRGIVQGYRGSLESRSSAAIPFSYSSFAMDQAFANLQYSRQRMSDSYQYIGNEAAYMSARYLSR